MLRQCRLPVSLLLVFFWPVPGGAQDKTFEAVVSLEPLGRLALETGRGTVRLTSWDRATVDIQARISPPMAVDGDEGQRSVDGTTIEVRGRRRSVRIRSVYSALPAPVHYEIRAPREVDLDLTIDRSDTLLDGFEGRLLLQFDRSDLTANDLTGTIVLDLDRGAFHGVDLSGAISLGLDRGQSVVLERVRGSLQFDLDRTSATMREVQIDGDSLIGIDRGDLELQLVPGQALTVEADVTDRSDLSSDLPVTFQQGGRRLQGSLNGGGPSLKITADRGSIQLDTN